MTRMKQELPGIDTRARAWIRQQQAPEHGGPEPGGAGFQPRTASWSDDIDAFLNGFARVGAAVADAGRQVQGMNAINRHTTIEINQPKSGRNRDTATCAIVLQPEAVSALLDATPAVREAAIVALLAALKKDMSDFFQP